MRSGLEYREQHGHTSHYIKFTRQELGIKGVGQ